MFLKIDREVCLAKFRSFPLSPYDPNTDEEVYYFPKQYKSNWFSLPPAPNHLISRLLGDELTKFVISCKFDRLIFLSDKDAPWITKLSAGRTDYAPLTKAMQYFEQHKLGKKFNGGIEVSVDNLPEFFKHYSCIVKCDASFHAGFFSDIYQSFIGDLHYSGEIRFSLLKKKFEKTLDAAISKTKFVRNKR
jgi:hypothetical protein